MLLFSQAVAIPLMVGFLDYALGVSNPSGTLEVT